MNEIIESKKHNIQINNGINDIIYQKGYYINDKNEVSGEYDIYLRDEKSEMKITYLILSFGYVVFNLIYSGLKHVNKL